MKYLATGDLHLNARSWLGPEFLDEQAKVWRAICELAVSEQVDALLFAGDAFEHRRPTPAELRAFQEPLSLLYEAEIPALAVLGNHDRDSADGVTALEVATWESCMSVHREPGVWRDSIATMPWTPIGRLIAAQNGGDRDALNAQAAELLIDTARGLREQVTEPAILMLHWSVSGSALPNGLPVDQLREPVLPVTELEEQGWDAVVCGHIHKAQLMGSEDARGPLFYVGSAMPLNFGEADVEHGCWLLDYSDAILPYRFVPLDGPRFVTINWASQDYAHLPPLALDSADGAVLRLRYTVTAEEARRIDQRELRQALLDAGAWKVVVQPQIVREERARVEGMDESLSELQALDAYIASHFAAQMPSDEEALALAERMRDRTKDYLEAARS